MKVIKKKKYSYRAVKLKVDYIEQINMLGMTVNKAIEQFLLDRNLIGVEETKDFTPVSEDMMTNVILSLSYIQRFLSDNLTSSGYRNSFEYRINEKAEELLEQIKKESENMEKLNKR